MTCRYSLCRDAKFNAGGSGGNPSLSTSVFETGGLEDSRDRFRGRTFSTVFTDWAVIVCAAGAASDGLGVIVVMGASELSTGGKGAWGVLTFNKIFD